VVNASKYVILLVLWMQFCTGCLALGSLVVEALSKLTSHEFCEKLPAIGEGRDEKEKLSSFSQIMIQADDEIQKPANYYSSNQHSDAPVYDPYAQREQEL
jgi:hypothetical protein